MPQVNYKPAAKRLELTTALDVHGHNYNSQADASKKLNSIVLKSQGVNLPASFAIGCLRGDTLMLSPLDEALQMRPQLGHLDDMKKAVKDEDMMDEEEKKPTYVTVITGKHIWAYTSQQSNLRCDQPCCDHISRLTL